MALPRSLYVLCSVFYSFFQDVAMSAYTTNISLMFGSNFSETHINRSRSGAQVGRSSSLTASHHTESALSSSLSNEPRPIIIYGLILSSVLPIKLPSSEKLHPYIIPTLCISGCHALLSRLTWDFNSLLGSMPCGIFQMCSISRSLEQVAGSDVAVIPSLCDGSFRSDA